MKPAAPVREEDRLAGLDVVRGVAVLGILYMNIQSYSMIMAAYRNPSAYGDLTGANFLVWVIGDLFFHHKFIGLFSILFGAGIVLLWERLRASGRPTRRIHFRRNVVLAGIGLLHAHGLWSGDILFPYALCGLLLFPFRRMSARALVIMGVSFLVLEVLLSVYFGSARWQTPYEDTHLLYAFQPHPNVVEYDLEVFRGTWTHQLTIRVGDALYMETFAMVFDIFWWIGGLMLIGMALQKSRFFTAGWDPGAYLGWVVAALVIGLPITAAGTAINVLTEWDYQWSASFGGLPNQVAGVILSLGIASAVLLWTQLRILAGTGRPRSDRALFGLSFYDRLAATGRMALTNYLTQTIICTTLFYGHGFGLYGKIERTGQLGIVLAIWALQLLWSPMWLRYFRFGPFEWLWRSLTYLRPQPMLR